MGPFMALTMWSRSPNFSSEEEIQQPALSLAGGLPGPSLTALAQPCNPQSWEGESLQGKPGCARGLPPEQQSECVLSRKDHIKG